MRRSEFVHYHPGSWTLTYEEGLAPEDIEGGAPFQRAARRGLLEELTARAGKVSLNDFRAVSVVLEQPLGNPAVIVIANLPLSRNDLEGHVSSDEFDRNSLTTIPIDETYLEAVMTGAASVFGKRAGRWHPTSRYRLLATIAHFFGEEASARVLSRIPRDRAGRR
jgi:hypothetical protein